MRRVIAWLTAAIVVTLIFGSTYAALQQLGRRSANAAPAPLSYALGTIVLATTFNLVGGLVR